jgi:two-component system chemotaxis response regulator CheB
VARRKSQRRSAVPTRDIIVIGASAGGVEALKTLVQGLPADLPAAVFVVLHMAPGATSVLPKILARAGPLPAAYARDHARVTPGAIYIAPPDRHLILMDGRMTLEREAAEHRQRPAADPLFRSAAGVYGSRVVGVVLSGTLDDGTDGLLRIKEAGGVAVVQDPTDAAFDAMPRNALSFVAVDHVLPVAQIPSLLDRLAREPVRQKPPREPSGQPLGKPADVFKGDPGASPSFFACPDCGGVLWEHEEEKRLSYRCRVGHAFTLVSLAAAQSSEIETALWASLRAVEERVAVIRRMIERADGGGAPRPARVAHLRREQRHFETQAATLRRLIGSQRG